MNDSAASTRVAMTTSLGVIELALDVRAAPLTAQNFLRYVSERRYVGASFYRAMRREHWTPGRELELVQGGLAVSGNQPLAPIAHESPTDTRLLHKRGTISMARAAIDTASSEFFICVDDCPGLDPTATPTPPADGLGYAAFGHVTKGMDVVIAIQQRATSIDAPIEAMRGQILLEPVTILKFESLV